MNKIHVMMLTIFFTSVLSSSCKKEERNIVTDPADQREIAKNYYESAKIWAAFKAANNNSYSYTVLQSSSTGENTEIKLKIDNGKIIQRDYVHFRQDGSIRKIIFEWQEKGNQVGIVPDMFLLNLDEVYTMARNVWLKADITKNDVYFEAKNNGILSVAGHTPKDCMDDCFIGIHITNVSK